MPKQSKWTQGALQNPEQEPLGERRRGQGQTSFEQEETLRRSANRSGGKSTAASHSGDGVEGEERSQSEWAEELGCLILDAYMD